MLVCMLVQFWYREKGQEVTSDGEDRAEFSSSPLGFFVVVFCFSFFETVCV